MYLNRETQNAIQFVECKEKNKNHEACAMVNIQKRNRSEMKTFSVHIDETWSWCCVSLNCFQLDIELSALELNRLGRTRMNGEVDVAIAK